MAKNLGAALGGHIFGLLGLPGSYRRSCTCTSARPSTAFNRGHRAGDHKQYISMSRVRSVFQRFFFPWPRMPHQQFDENMDRVACQRRCEEDDQDTRVLGIRIHVLARSRKQPQNGFQWLNPHNWYLMMFSPSTIHVLPFDPQHGSDDARVYAGKYASKPEKDYCVSRCSIYVFVSQSTRSPVVLLGDRARGRSAELS